MSNLLRWSATLLDSFYTRGVRHAIISPGSRSTPLTLAAAIHPGIRKQVVLDERSAAFVALGIGKSTGMPALLICTSGSAVANYMPAVVEAKESGVPMVLLTADRPPKLRNLGSSQTVDQIKLFGDQAVYFHEAGEPVDNEEDMNRMDYLAGQAVEVARDYGGAAHINLPFRKPLEPTRQHLLNEKTRLADRRVNESFKPVVHRSEIRLDKKIIDLVSSSNRPLLVAGPSDPWRALDQQISKLASCLGAPVLAEPGSQIADVSTQIFRFDSFIRNPEIRQSLTPDLIIRFGDQPYSSSLLLALDKWKKVPLIHFSSRRPVQDHAMSIDHKIVLHKQDTIRLSDIQSNSMEHWMKQWKEQEETYSKKMILALETHTSLTDGSLVNHFSSQLSSDWNVMLSNSLPVRDMLSFGESKNNQFVNRGTAGIDGIMSTALGVHLSTDKPTCCFIGDLAFLHDSNALYTLQQADERPFVAVVINNNGGNIFQMLPIHRKEERALPEDIYQTYFQTPQKTDISHLAKASGIDYIKIDSPGNLKNFDINDLHTATIIECVTDSKESMDLRNSLLR